MNLCKNNNKDLSSLSEKIENNDLSSILFQCQNPINLNNTILSSQSQEEPTNNYQRTHLSEEETKIEREIIKAITRGKPESLKPNSGEAITIGENYVCVSFHDDIESDYRVWEWHGHVVSYNEEIGYKREYFCGNYYERFLSKVLYEYSDEENEERGRFGWLNLTNGRFFCRNLGDNSSRS